MKPFPRTARSEHSSTTCRRIIAGSAALALLLTAGCSSSASSTGSTAPAGSGSSTTAGATQAGGAGLAAMQTELAKASAFITSYPAIKPIAGGVGALKGKTVWWVPIGATLQLMAAIGANMKIALGKMGASLHVCDGKLLPTAIASCMDDAASQSAAAVVTGFIDYSLVPNAFDNLAAKHIPVLVGGEAASGGKTNSPSLAFYDTIATQTLLQKQMAQSVIVDSGGKAKVLFLGSSDSSQLRSTAAYTKKYFQDNCSGCSVNEIDYLTIAASKLPSQVSAGLISHPDTTYLVEQIDPTAGLVMNALQTSGKSNSVKYAGTGGSLDTMQRLAAGKGVLSDAGISAAYTAWQFVDGIARMAAGSTPVVTVTATRLFTKDNIATLKLTPANYASIKWFGSDEYIATFTKAWGLS